MDLDRVRVHKPDKSILRIDYRPARETDELLILLRTDAHHDNAHTDWDLERGGAPKPRGAVWLKARMIKNSQIDYELQEAR